MTIEDLNAKYSWLGATVATWHQHPKGLGWVENTATVEETAYIGHDAVVYGNAKVCGNAKVYDGCWILPVVYIVGTAHAVCVCAPGRVKIGCQDHTISEWLDRFLSIGKAHGYTETQITEYEMYLKLCPEWLKMYPGTDCGNKPKRDAKGRFVKANHAIHPTRGRHEHS